MMQLGPCPVTRAEHEIHAWNVAFTGPSVGVACKTCHKTWIADEIGYTPTYSIPSNIPQGWVEENFSHDE